MVPETDFSVHFLKIRQRLVSLKPSPQRLVLLALVAIFGFITALNVLAFVMLGPASSQLGSALICGVIVCVLLTVGRQYVDRLERLDETPRVRKDTRSDPS